MATDVKIPDALSKGLKLPSGAQFRRCALQVNPYSYAERYRGQDTGLDEREYNRRLIDRAEELSISVLGITDHNHAGDIATLRALAQGRGICIFPGFELTSSEGIHVLCLYDPETTEEQLSRYLGEFGVTDVERSSAPCAKSFAETLECVYRQGGVAIAAHATNAGGLLATLSGRPRANAWKHEKLLAIQIPGSIDDLPDEYRQIVRNQDPAHKRSRPVSDELAVAVVNARDVVEPDDLADPSATCLIKMSEVSIDGLRQAFLDPGSRIRLNSDPTPEEHAEIVAIAWEGGFLDGQAVAIQSSGRSQIRRS